MEYKKLTFLNTYKMIYETLIENLEQSILNYIYDEWNINLPVMVHYCDDNIEITVFEEELDYERFEFFIINELCKIYGCEVTNRTICSAPKYNKLRYCEWDLYLIKKE